MSFRALYAPILEAEKLREELPYFLAHLRRAAGMSQADLAEEIGRTQAYVSMVEAGHRIPDAGLTARILGLLAHRADPAKIYPAPRELVTALRAKFSKPPPNAWRMKR